MAGSGDRIVRIGGASGSWGDSAVAVPQLLRRAKVDYLVFDYLAELTMSILAGARLKRPELGYATDFVDVTMAAMLGEIRRAGIRVVSNAGGVNPRGCAAAIEAIAQAQGIAVRIAVVEGDDVMPLLPALRGEDIRELQSGQALPAKLLTANAYLGALPIKRALDDGADIVITGRCVDSAVTLGALMHEFGWSAGDLDKLAQGSLAGHIIECGCQATGGLFTDWQTVPRWDDIGYPIVECRADGNFVVAKPEGTGGLVTPATVGEQVLYEIGDPAAYILPDVVCDFSAVRLVQAGENRVAVSGAKGRPPTPFYKVSATYADGYKCSAQLTIVGMDAAAKVRRTAEAILARTRAMLQEANLADYGATNLEILGAESLYGPHARADGLREAVMRLTVTHRDRRALDLFAREISPAGTSWAPGTTGLSGRPKPAMTIKQFAFLLPKERLVPRVVADGGEIEVSVPGGVADAGPPASTRAPAGAMENLPPKGATEDVPLIALAYGRSGDKGDISNIGIIARRPEYLPHLRRALTEERVAQHLAHLVRGTVTRYDAPGFDAMNFVCEQALDGGGMTSLRNDPWGKSMAQILLAMPVTVPRGLVRDS